MNFEVNITLGMRAMVARLVAMMRTGCALYETDRRFRARFDHDELRVKFAEHRGERVVPRKELL